jgi:EAL domain-containing protein (putative c-di-GMP-specific phosphodiesterase class I)
VALALRRRQFRIVTAEGAREALNVLSREPVAVVISGEQMPVMNGTSFLTEVRRQHPTVVRMILSGNMDPHTISRAVNEAGVFRYLLKPCSSDDLGLAVEQAIEAHTAHLGTQPLKALSISMNEGIASLQMAMQPIFNSRGDLVAHEALLRLPAHPDVSVADLLDTAAREGRLWELERAIRRAVAQRMAGRPTGSAVFVNLHPHSLLDPQLYTTSDPLASHAAAVVFEITERGSLEDVKDLPARVAALRDLGYRVAIDDMGSGYSGLTAFTTILPDFVKFDRELIRAMHNTPAKHKLVSSITRVCRELGVATIAEGVEDALDLAAARAMGCTLLQGYLLGRPAVPFRETPSTAVVPPEAPDTDEPSSVE